MAPSVSVWENEGGGLVHRPGQNCPGLLRTSADTGAGRPGGLAVSGGFRSQLSVGGDVVDLATWAGSVPHAGGVAPRVRVGHTRWFNLLWLLPIGFVVLVVSIAVGKGLRSTATVQAFVAAHPGTLTAGVEPGLPWWVDVTHFLNLFLLIFIVRSGLQILSDHPRLYWTRHSTPGRDWEPVKNSV